MTKFVVSLTENDPTKITNFTREQKIDGNVKKTIILD